MVGKNKLFHVVTNIIMILLCASCLLPLILLGISSFTAEEALAQNGYSFFPMEWSLGAYRYIMNSTAVIVKAYGMTIIVTALGTIINVLMTIMIAYPLSKKNLPGRNMIAFMVFFTMLFRGGTVPTYIMWTQIVNVKDTILGQIVPNLMLNAFFIIMMRTYFTTSIPYEIIEAGKIDGASEMKILSTIVIPLSKPMIATISLMTGLSYWNDWMNGMYFLLKNRGLYTIQNVLNAMINNAAFLANSQNTASAASGGMTVPSVGVRMAIAVIALIPVIVVYPFFQKFFVKGIVVGGVKG